MGTLIDNARDARISLAYNRLCDEFADLPIGVTEAVTHVQRQQMIDRFRRAVDIANDVRDVANSVIVERDKIEKAKGL